jgi:hypothetical protein
MHKREWEWAAGHFDYSAFMRVRDMLFRLAEGENFVTGREDELLVLPKGWPLPPPDGLYREFREHTQPIIDRAVAAGTFGLSLETVIQIVENTKTTREAAEMAASMRVLMGSTDAKT